MPSTNSKETLVWDFSLCVLWVLLAFIAHPAFRWWFIGMAIVVSTMVAYKHLRTPT